MTLPQVLAAAGESTSYWPFAVLAIGILFVIVMIGVLRVHAFIALILAAIIVGFFSTNLPFVIDADPPTAEELSLIPEKDQPNHFVQSVKLTMQGFGKTAGGIAWVIALAAIIGVCLMESGAADRIVRGMVRTLGEKRAGPALVLCSFFLSVPVFFDTVFFLLIPLAQALAYRLGRNYLYFVMAVCSGGVVTHGLVPPTPGPLAMVDELGLNLGFTIVAGVALGLIPAFAGLYFGRWLDGRMNLEIRESPGIKMADIQEIVAKEDKDLPSFFMSMMPVILPVFLIAFASFYGAFVETGTALYVLEIFGDKNIAMFLGTLIALYLLAKQKGYSVRALGKVMEEPLSMAGMIILITAGGGAFGKMIKASGVGDSIEAVAGSAGISYILLAWLVAGVLKVAQGSGTVSMMTTVGIFAAFVGNGAEIGYDPIYIFAAIAFGSQMGSWMNDSGFWVVCKMSGFTESETLRTWTVLLAVMGIVGLIEVFVVSSIIPFPFGAPEAAAAAATP